VQGNVALEKSERKKPFAWMPDLGWEDAVRLAQVIPKTFGNLLEDIEENGAHWKKVCSQTLLGGPLICLVFNHANRW